MIIVLRMLFLETFFFISHFRTGAVQSLQRAAESRSTGKILNGVECHETGWRECICGSDALSKSTQRNARAQAESASIKWVNGQLDQTYRISQRKAEAKSSKRAIVINRNKLDIAGKFKNSQNRGKRGHTQKIAHDYKRFSARITKS